MPPSRTDAGQLQLAGVHERSLAEFVCQTRSVSQQEADQQSSAYTQAVANNAAAEANVRRLQQLESF